MGKNNKKIFIMVASRLAENAGQDWQQHLPSLKMISEVEPVFIDDKDAGEVMPADWLRLAGEIYRRADQAGGFIVIHGLDNILYASCALSFLLQNLSHPIIFTALPPGGQAEKTETRANLINACQAATYEFGEVCLMFGNRLLRANQSRRQDEESLNIFTAPAAGILGRIDFSLRIFDNLVIKPKGKTKFFGRLSENIETIDLGPTLKPEALTARLAKAEGVAINAWPYQNMPANLIRYFEKNRPDLPVAVWTKQISDFSAWPKNMFLAGNLTWEAAVTKLMWALAQHKSADKIKELMQANVAGELKQ